MDRELMRDSSALLGRIFLSAIFLVSAYTKVTDWHGMSTMMTDRGLQGSALLLMAALACELLGSLSVLLGLKTRLGALALVAFLIPTTLIFHNFWALPVEQQSLQTVMFLKNLAIIGGLFMLAAHGPGRFSFDRPRRFAFPRAGLPGSTLASGAAEHPKKTPVWSSSTQ